MSDLLYESDSHDKFKGYLGPEDGPVAYRSAEDEATLTPRHRSHSLDDLTATEGELGLAKSLLSRLSPPAHLCKLAVHH